MIKSVSNFQKVNLPVFRRLGIRTSYEIDHERYALKALRGDFDSVGHDCANTPAVLLQAAEK